MDSPETAKLITMLQNRHSGFEWATFAELPTRTGGAAQRLDFFAMNLWESNKYIRVAYEIKVSRSDFLREMDQPQKRADAERLANQCFFVTPAGLVKPDEIPQGWGLLEATKAGLRRKKVAQQRVIDPPPIWFVASLARRTADDLPDLPPVIWRYAGEEILLEHLREAADAAVRRDADSARVEAEAMKKQVVHAANVYKAVRNVIGDWAIEDPEQLRQALEGVRDYRKYENNLEYKARLLRSMAEEITEIAAKMDRKNGNPPSA